MLLYDDPEGMPFTVVLTRSNGPGAGVTALEEDECLEHPAVIAAAITIQNERIIIGLYFLY